MPLTLAEVRAEYVKVLPYLVPNQPEIIVGDFWYTFKVCPESCQCKGQFCTTIFGQIGSCIVVHLNHYIMGSPGDLMIITVLQRVKDGEKEKEVIILRADNYPKVDDSHLQEILEATKHEEFIASLKQEYHIH